MNGVQTRFKCKLDVKRCKRFVFPPSSLLPRSNALKTKAIRYFQTDRTLTRIVSPPLYAWWNRNSRHYYWRIYGGELAIRKYFNRTTEGSPLNGHHIGIYGQVFTYDFETGGHGYMGGKPGGTLWEKMNYSAGLEYGYSLPITRRLNLDFVIGVGYWGGAYYEYLPTDNHYVWQATKQRRWFGPTKAEMSLVWLLGNGNYNAKKGGKR